MTAQPSTTIAPPAVLVDSYADLGYRLWKSQAKGHGSMRCGCLACADARAAGYEPR